MKIEFKGKTAIVSGSTSGIGFAIAQGLAEGGARVVINGRDHRRVDEALSRLHRAVPNAGALGMAADLGTPDGVARMIAQVPQADILVNNLGIFEPKGFFEIDDADWLRFFEVNVMSGVRLSRHYAKGMEKKSWGRVIFIASESAVQIPNEMVHYGVSKTAQLAVSRGLAETLAGTGVTVNAVLPGPTRSEGVIEYLAQLAAQSGVSVEEAERSFLDLHRPTSIIRRFAAVEEVANLVVYLASDQASATTGAAVRVDGGILRSVI